MTIDQGVSVPTEKYGAIRLSFLGDSGVCIQGKDIDIQTPCISKQSQLATYHKLMKPEALTAYIDSNFDKKHAIEDPVPCCVPPNSSVYWRKLTPLGHEDNAKKHFKGMNGFKLVTVIKPKNQVVNIHARDFENTGSHLKIYFEDANRAFAWFQRLTFTRLSNLIEYFKSDFVPEGVSIKEPIYFPGYVPGPQTSIKETDNVKMPKHYQIMAGIESIQLVASSLTADEWRGWCLGNWMKYRFRAGKKDPSKQTEDIAKAEQFKEFASKQNEFKRG